MEIARMPEENGALSDEVVVTKIFVVRGQKVMLDFDLAELYQVPTKRLKEQVKRNIERFPEDFMFRLTQKELNNLRKQSLPSSWGGLRISPFAFTEQGVAMLSSVLNSSLAIKVNIQIIRIFTRMRALWLSNQEILLRLEQLDKRVEGHDEDIQQILAYLKQLLAAPPPPPRNMIGFKS